MRCVTAIGFHAKLLFSPGNTARLESMSFRLKARFEIGAADARVCFAVAASLCLWLAGCGRKEAEKVPAPVATNQARLAPAPTGSESDFVLSEKDADMLKAGGHEPANQADAAWEELAKALEPPPEPPEWQLKEPTKLELAAFKLTNSVLAAAVADKAKDFYTRFPNHEKAADAHQQEYALIALAVQMGNTNRGEQLLKMEDARLKDPSLSEDDRLELRMQQLQRSAGGDQETNMAVTLAQLEKGARALQKEFPKRPEVAGLLLSVAQGWLDNSDTEKSRALAREVGDAALDEEAKANAQELLKKIERVGKPLDLKFKAVDGRAVDLQQMKGRVVLIDFWATWCGPCLAELPKVKAAFEKLNPKGFDIIGISFDRQKADLEKFLAKEKMPWPQYFEEGEEGKKLGDELGISGIPTMWLVDKKGALRELNAREGLEEKVEKLLAEK